MFGAWHQGVKMALKYHYYPCSVIKNFSYYKELLTITSQGFLLYKACTIKSQHNTLCASSLYCDTQCTYIIISIHQYMQNSFFIHPHEYHPWTVTSLWQWLYPCAVTSLLSFFLCRWITLAIMTSLSLLYCTCTLLCLLSLHCDFTPFVLILLHA